MARFVTRFAPSPTGPLHLGHAYSALLTHDMARAAGGQFHLRIEDIDQSRARPAWERQIYDDLSWLGISWDGPVMRQSDRLPVYQAALNQLWARGLLFACNCTRRDIEDALSAPQEGVPLPLGPDGVIYPGTCRPEGALQNTVRPRDAVLRLNMGLAAAAVCQGHGSGMGRSEGSVGFMETCHGPVGQHGHIGTSRDELLRSIGDIVLARHEMGTSYHLSVVLDDAAQGITHVLRGEDLFDATRIHVVLQKLLDLPTPIYCHHRLIRDSRGKRLAKRDDARSLSKYRAEGATPEDIRRMVGLA